MSPRRRSVLLITSAVVALALIGAGGGGWWYVSSLDDQIARTDAFGPTPGVSRPAKVAPDALNFLLMGADEATTESDSQVEPGAARADTIMLVHVPADRKSAQVISIPRDTWVTVPPSGDGTAAREAKINAAFAWGQAPLMVRTVETFTGVHIDHTVVVAFDGFARVIDALGGIDITVDTTFTSASLPKRVFTAGPQHMDGAAALDYARQRKPFADGDFTRVRHQRDILGAVFDSASRLNVLSGPAKLDSVIRSAAGAVTVDQTLSIVDMVRTLADLKRADLSMLTSPSSGTGMIGDQSVVFCDQAAAYELYDAVRTDHMGPWLAAHPQPSQVTVGG
jgi:LCP family protein required for cell wall assembly